MFLNEKEEKIISHFLSRLNQYDIEEMKLLWLDGSVVFANFDTCFEDDNGLVYLDLTKTDIKKVGDVYIQGIDKIVMRPSSPKKIARHLGGNNQNPKTKIYE